MSIQVEGAAGPDRLQRWDSLYVDAEKISNDKYHGSGGSWAKTLQLAFQSIGIVYGDVGTSPLYVYSSVFPDGIKHQDDLVGVLSLILYTLILIPMIKYAFIVLYANDNGDGGTFALYSLISRYANIRMIPNQQTEDENVSNYSIETPSSQLRRAQWVKQKLESSKGAKIALFTITILGTSMVMGDGTLTPAISVLSAVSGIREKAPSLTQLQVMWISVPILFVLFSVQRFGTDKVGYSFTPVISVWFLLIAGTGMYNLIVHDITILRAFNPKYIVDYFKRNGKEAWVSLGGVVLCITGTEAMFADLGHFNITAIQLSFTCVLFPSVALCYMGQAAYLHKFPENVGDTFYKSIPEPLFWPVFVVAIMAAIIASQAMLSGAFAILSKALSLGCFPRVEVVHTSNKYEGQVYIPEVNFLIGAASVAVTLAFQTTTNIGNAYGICVVTVFSITTHLMTVVMLLIWKERLPFIAAFYVVFSLAEFTYLSSILSKFTEGGYLPFCFSLVLMATWHYVHVRRYGYELDHIMSATEMTALLERRDGIPPVFPCLVDKIPSVHVVFVFMSIKHLPIPRVALPERFIFRRVGPVGYHMFRCVARYGYTDPLEGPNEFTALLLGRLKMFIQEEAILSTCQTAPVDEADDASSVAVDDGTHDAHLLVAQPESTGNSKNNDNDGHVLQRAQATVDEEKRFIDAEAERGVVYLMGEANVTAAAGSSVMKWIVVNYVYTFLRKNLRQGHKALSVPKDQLLKVGVTYEI
ncbi:hypothetical protein ABZP36_023465 [Zizania latifolia]